MSWGKRQHCRISISKNEKYEMMGEVVGGKISDLVALCVVAGVSQVTTNRTRDRG